MPSAVLIHLDPQNTPHIIAISYPLALVGTRPSLRTQALKHVGGESGVHCSHMHEKYNDVSAN